MAAAISGASGWNPGNRTEPRSGTSAAPTETLSVSCDSVRTLYPVGMASLGSRGTKSGSRA